MEIKAYYFGCEVDGKVYVVCLDGAHAAIRPIKEVHEGTRTLITYTHLGAARKALKSRSIKSFYVGEKQYPHYNEEHRIKKNQLRLRAGKLTLDIDDEV